MTKADKKSAVKASKSPWAYFGSSWWVVLSLSWLIMAWSWLILGPSSPFLGLPWAVLTHLGPILSKDSSQDGMHWGGGTAFLSAFRGRNGAQNYVVWVSFRGFILVMIFSSLRNDFYGSRVLFRGVIFVILCMYSHLIFCRKSHTEFQFLLLRTTLELA